MKFTVVGEPVAKQRPRRGKNGQFYTPRETQAYEDLVAWTARTSGAKLEGGRGLAIVVSAYVSPRVRQKMPDLDNIVKSVLDGIVKSGVIDDDVDIDSIQANRIVSDQPKVEVTIVYSGRRYEADPQGEPSPDGRVSPD